MLYNDYFKYFEETTVHLLQNPYSFINFDLVNYKNNILNVIKNNGMLY